MAKNVKKLVHEIYPILVKYVINLSRGIDNCLGHNALITLSKKDKQIQENLKFLSKNTDFNLKDSFYKKLYKRAFQKEKNIKTNTVPYNLSIVIFVTALETLFYDLFSYIVNSNLSLKTKYLESDKKINVKYLEKYKWNEISFADIVIETKGFNFQSINSINEAFKWAEGIDICEFMNKVFPNINTIIKLKELIEKRHRIIHEAYNDNKLNFNKIKEIHAFLFTLGVNTFLYIFSKKLKEANDLSE